MNTRYFSIICCLLSIVYCLDLKAQAVSVSGFSIELEAPMNPITTNPPIYIPAVANKTSTADIIPVFDNNFDLSYMPAVDYACGIWETYIKSDVPIRIFFSTSEFGQAVLARTNISNLYHNLSSEPSFTQPFGIEYYDNTLYVATLANNLVGRDLSSGGDAIKIDINLDYNSRFYLGTDGGVQTNQWDLVTLLLHEMAHGFGMIDYITETNGQFTYEYQNTGFPLVYCHFIEDYTNRKRMTSIPVNTVELSNFLQSDDLHFAGTLVEAYASDPYPKIYAPNPFELGSSISHLDENTYDADSEESITTPKS